MTSTLKLNEETPTLLQSDTETEGEQQQTPKKRRKKRKPRKFVPNYDIPGVHRLILPEETQYSIGCVVGENVTVEKPWTKVEKESIVEHLDLHAESSEFLPIKPNVMDFTGRDLLVGYIPDESQDFDEFYVCVTEEAINQINAIIEKVQTIQEDKLKNAVEKKIKRWKSMGSHLEIDESMVKHHRSLIEVEVETKYPILPFKVQFRFLKTQQMRDGYMELKPTDESSSVIFKKRIDASVQVTPSVSHNEAQTICPYPRNSYTQYQYEVPEAADSMNFIPDNLESLCEILRVNGCIDFYGNDYEKLITDPNFAKQIPLLHPTDYFCFIDMKLCGNKMISKLEFHPMWSGCMITSYVDTAPSLYQTTKQTTDEVLKAVHDFNPVLLWSFKDDLKPRLLLETPRSIFTLSCCPHEPNIIIGGCVNGQIIIWDITNRLQNVEEEEILTVNQQSYRDYMFSLMEWMKNIFDPARVRPAALSNPRYSHRGCINHISWMSPFHTVTKTGKIEDEDGKKSLQLITSAEDGTILIWNLLMKPIVERGGFKAVRKLKRLKKKPSALAVLESPFQALHLNLRPIYRINLVVPHAGDRHLSISALCTNFFQTMYHQTNTAKSKLIERIIYQPNLQVENSNPKKVFYAGTMEGDFVHGSWEGKDFDSGEAVNYENSGIIHCGKYHDGPVVSVDCSKTAILTVGGKVFAIWEESFKNRPVVWRKSSSIYTSGSWVKFDESAIRLTRVDGYIEIWSLASQSKIASETWLMSNGALTSATVHPRQLRYNILACCDYRGSLRLFKLKFQQPALVKTRENLLSSFLSEEVKRKSEFLNWQRQWNELHKVSIEIVQEEKPIVFEKSSPRKKLKEKSEVRVSAGQRYLDFVQEQHRIGEQTRIKNIILMKKQLDTEDLLKKREPLRKLEVENEIKKKKQKNKLKDADKIFKEQIAMLFPDVVKAKPIPPPDPYEDSYNEETKTLYIENYTLIAIEAVDYVEEHPFTYDFSWKSVLKTGRERRRKLNEAFDADNHRMRYEQVKIKRMGLQQQMVTVVEETPDDVSMAISMSQSTVTNF